MSTLTYQNFAEPVRRGRAILGIILALTVATWLSWIDLERQTHIAWKFATAPIIAFSKGLEQALVATPLPTPYVSPKVASASATPKASIKPSIKPAAAAKQKVTVIYVTPAPQATPKPGDPGSPEWDAEFKRKWDEMSANNAAMQQKVEASQKQFCIDNPNLCK